MRARDKFIVVALIGLLVVVSGAAVAIDRAETKTIVPAYGGTYVARLLAASSAGTSELAVQFGFRRGS